MKISQKGFAALEGILILVIIAIIGGTGYYVWHSKNQTDKTLIAASNTNQTTTTKTNKQLPTQVVLHNGGTVLETFGLPTSWSTRLSANGQTGLGSCSITATSTLTAIDSGEAVPTELDKNPENSVLLNYDIVKQPDTKSLADYFTDDLFQGDDGTSHTGINYTVNDNTAYHYKGVGSGVNSVYEDDYYLISHNGYVACFNWRPIDQTSSPGYDNSKYTSIVESIVNSTQFN